MSDCTFDPGSSEQQVCRAAEAAAAAAEAANRLADRAAGIEEWVSMVTALGGLILPVAAVLFLWRLWPVLQQIFEARKFSIKMGAFELSAQDATDQLVRQVTDLQEKVAQLEAAATPAPAGEYERVPDQPHAVRAAPQVTDQRTVGTRILWVDDIPKNNALEVKSLTAMGYSVTTVLSTREAEAVLEQQGADIILSDMGRPEGRDAGIDLLRRLRDAGDDVPYGFYTSARSIARLGEEMDRLGAFVATSSFSDLVAALRGLNR
ncbi:MAG: response regulator [Pseudomonadota bacterium]